MEYRLSIALPVPEEPVILTADISTAKMETEYNGMVALMG